MKVIALDFECANTFAYYSICWTGIVVSNENLEEKEIISQKCNPTVGSFFAGKINFPFTIKDLRKEKVFKCNHRFLTDLLTEDTLVIGHAINNDISMLIAACLKFRIKMPTFNYIDSNVVYSVYKNEFKETSLKTIADEFGIEYVEHDPSEDARATLAAVREIAKRENTDLNGLIEKYGIVVGKVKNMHAYKTYSTKMNDKTVNKMQYVNSTLEYFDSIERDENAKCRQRFHIDDNILAQFDTRPLMQAMAKDGAKLMDCARNAQFDVKFGKAAGSQPRKKMLYEIYEQFGVEYNVYKMLRSDNVHEYISGFFVGKRNSDLTKQFKEVLRSTVKKDNALKLRRICISKGIEKLVGYDRVFRTIAEHNGKFSAYMDQAHYLIVLDKEELENDTYSCKKIESLKKRDEEHPIKILTYDEFEKI
mgnify:CR=1 FL=1